MTDKETKFYSRVFTLAGLWNISIALTGILFYEYILSWLFTGMPDPAVPLLPLFFRFFMTAVLLFGIGYIMVALDPSRNRAIVWIGSAGKIIIFSTFVWYYCTGTGSLFLLAGSAGDFLWTILFLYFLWSTRNDVLVNIFIG